jgi:hypothetical protein
MRAVPDDRVARWVMGVLTALVVAAIPTLALTWAKVRDLPTASEIAVLQAEVRRISTDKQRDDTQDKAIDGLDKKIDAKVEKLWCRAGWSRDAIYDLQVATKTPRTSPRCGKDDP